MLLKLLPQAASQNSTNEEMNTQFGPSVWQHFQDNIGFKSIIIAPVSACKCHRRSLNNSYEEHILFLMIRKKGLTSLPLLGLMLSKTRRRVQWRFLFFSAGLGLHLVSQSMRIYSCLALFFLNFQPFCFSCVHIQHLAICTCFFLELIFWLFVNFPDQQLTNLINSFMPLFQCRWSKEVKIFTVDYI